MGELLQARRSLPIIVCRRNSPIVTKHQWKLKGLPLPKRLRRTELFQRMDNAIQWIIDNKTEYTIHWIVI